MLVGWEHVYIFVYGCRLGWVGVWLRYARVVVTTTATAYGYGYGYGYCWYRFIRVQFHAWLTTTYCLLL